MTGQDLIDEIREHLDEPYAQASGGGYFTDTRILSIINRTYYKVVMETECLTDYTNRLVGATYYNEAASTANSPTHTMPSSFMKVCRESGTYWFVDSKYDTPLIGTTQKELERDFGGASLLTSSGTPEYYVIRQREKGKSTGSVATTVDVYPYPSAAGHLLRMWFVVKPSAITTSTSPLFDDAWHDVITHGVVYPFKAKRKEWDGVSFHKGAYDDIMGKMKTYFTHKSKQDTRESVKDVYSTGRARMTFTATVAP